MATTPAPARQLLAIGIGPGDPDQVTVQAVVAIRRLDVLLVLDKGDLDADLRAVRRAVLDRHAPDAGHRVVVVDDPPRARGVSATPGAVEAWRAARTERLVEAVEAQVGAGEWAGLLVWGDPAVYDGSIATLQAVAARVAGDVSVRVVPGISSVQALAAAHQVPLNRAGGAVQLTTGRRLAAEGIPAGVDDLVVLLDHRAAFADLDEPDVEICWGAYLSTPDEVLVRGRLADVVDDVVAAREAGRARKGWLFDTYLLRRP